MRPTLISAIAGLAILVAAGAAPSAQAANARNPYGNVDPRNDAGNDTGDWQVDRLNGGQLNRSYGGPYYPAAPAAPPYYAAPGAYSYAPPYPPAYAPRAYYPPGYRPGW